MVLNWNTQRLTAHCKHGKITHSVSNSSLQHMVCVSVFVCVWFGAESVFSSNKPLNSNLLSSEFRLAAKQRKAESSVGSAV